MNPQDWLVGPEKRSYTTTKQNDGSVIVCDHTGDYVATLPNNSDLGKELSKIEKGRRSMARNVTVSFVFELFGDILPKQNGFNPIDESLQDDFIEEAIEETVDDLRDQIKMVFGTKLSAKLGASIG